MENDHIDWEALVHGANRAPSGDNTQPWEIRIAGNTLELYYVPAEKNPSLYEVGNIPNYLALGAWLHNMKVLALNAGYRATIVIPPSNDPAARVTLELGAEKEGNISAVFSRRTNRFPYTKQLLSSDMKLRLEKVLHPHAVSIAWIEGKEKDAFQHILPELHRLFWEFKAHRTSMLSILKLGKAKNAEVGIHRSQFGVPLNGIYASIGLFVAQHVSIALIWKPIRMIMSGIERRNLKYSSAIALLYVRAPDGLTHDGHKEFWLAAGMALEEFWLAATREGLAVQPFFGIIAIGLRKFFGFPSLTQTQSVIEDRANNLLQKYKSSEQDIAFMCMRVGTPKQTPRFLSLRKSFIKILRKQD